MVRASAIAGALTANIGSYSDGKPAHRTVSEYAVIQELTSSGWKHESLLRNADCAARWFPRMSLDSDGEPDSFGCSILQAVPSHGTTEGGWVYTDEHPGLQNGNSG